MNTTADLKPLSPSLLSHRAEFDYATFFLKLPPNYGFEDLFKPELWSFHEKKLSRHDMIRVVGENPAPFDVMLTITSKSLGVQVALYGGLLPAKTKKVAA